MSNVLMPNNISLPQLRLAWFGADVALADDHKTIGSLLREQVEKYEGTEKRIIQGDVAHAMDINQGTLSRIQNDRAPRKGGTNLLDPEQVVSMLKGYRIPESEFVSIARKFSLRLPERYFGNEDTQPVWAEGPRARWLGEVSAGNGNSSDGSRMVSVPDPIAERFDLNEVFAMTVSGTSMVCERVRDSIPEGSIVFFHRNLDPEPNEVVCCYLQDEDINVIKLWKPQKGYTFLESLNPIMRRQPITVTEDNPGVLKGVYLAHVASGSRLR